ncbi:Histidine phosphatase superfamily (branch 1) [Aquimarina amphilecti]|uniref:Histidine phosphatase superfamily (Branch 1) n=1 Tax=Aquimarina amphilecti TaxID=1038014 RepID=A0A1H7VV44_AQUAM|nr:phosphoglycerate mutase family protein [Aquimarina amphilecti]SEM12638.1 Histidine phosphatase superfamily (branch 1) [Aquimarina amphilecti]
MKTTYISAIILFVIVSFSSFAQETKDNKDTTTYILVRHSEKDTSDPSNRNPNLTEEGKTRSENLVRILKNINIDLVYSTDYLRTKQTASPIAKDRNIKVSIYDPRKLYDNQFQKETVGKTSVIVGHSNTTPTFVNKIMGMEKHKAIDEKDYTKLFIIKVTGDVITDTVLNID